MMFIYKILAINLFRINSVKATIFLFSGTFKTACGFFRNETSQNKNPEHLHIRY